MEKQTWFLTDEKLMGNTQTVKGWVVLEREIGELEWEMFEVFPEKEKAQNAAVYYREKFPGEEFRIEPVTLEVEG